MKLKGLVENLTKYDATLFRTQGKVGETRIIYEKDAVKCLVDPGKDEASIRKATASALKSLLQVVDQGIVQVQDLGNAKAAAQGAFLASYKYKSKNNLIIEPTLPSTEWEHGKIDGLAQNMARRLKDTPANHLTPRHVCDMAKALFKDSCEVHVRDEQWVKENGMNAFYSVGRGSEEPLLFLEIHYKPVQTDPIVLIGKGVTFDSGGISLKPSKDMHIMKGDMGGAAVVLSALWAIVSKKVPVNVIACIPLTENMPSGKATKPGDVVTAMNGKTIEIQNTDAEGRLILADAIHYSTRFKPCKIIELSTLTGAMDVALGAGYAGVFSNSDTLWKELEEAGKLADDPFWRMPLNSIYTSMLKSDVADLNNIGGPSGGSCSAAAFLLEFVPKDVPFAHIDIAGVMHHKGVKDSIIPSGMTGRPTRSIINLLESQK